MYIDSHAHLASPDVFPDIEGILARASQQQVKKIVNICTDQESLKNGLALAEKYPWIYNAAATTPHDVDKEGELFWPDVVRAAEQKKLIAIGESGLDYHYEHSDRKIQKEYLSRYFLLAAKSRLPLIFHCRDAFADLFSMADLEYKLKPAVLHCFTGDVSEAKGVLERGWYISFSGIVTFKKSEGLREAVKYAPLDRILIETDTPYLAPQSKRGKPNEPSYIPETAALIAQVKEVPLSHIAEATSANAIKFFSF